MRRPGQPPTHEHVVHTEERSGTLIADEVGQYLYVHAGSGNVRTGSIHRETEKREEELLFQLGNGK
jgi:hypothetical protein